MEQQLDDLKKELTDLRNDIHELKESVDSLIRTCARMDEHISFINGTYNAVRRPFALVLNAVNRTLGNGEQETLPQIEY